jgi:hypothetical protein
VTIHARIAAQEMNGTPLYRDFVSTAGASLERWLPRFDAQSCREHAARPARVDSGLAAVLGERNRDWGVSGAVLAALPGLGDGSVRAVVTGQQPGVAGGPLMSLHKAAAAIALARRIGERGRPCVPLFWLGADDDDFAEVRELCLIGRDLARLDAALEASAYRPGLRVGDMDGAAVRAVWSGVRPALPAEPALARIDALLSGATDFGDAAARALVAATGGEIAIVDGRTPQLRTAAAGMLRAFFDAEDHLRGLLESGGRELEAAGYHAQVQWGGDSGLFLLREGVRLRIPPEQREAARAEFARDITRVSPGVVARNLLQDAALSPVAVVLGPAEVAYRAQMAGVYREMSVDMPVVFPRLSATYLPGPVREMLEEAGLDAGEVARDAAGVAARVLERAPAGGLGAAASGLEETFERTAREFVAQAAAHLDERAQQKLRKRMEEIGGRLSQAIAAAVEGDRRGPRSRWPFLPRLGEIFVKDAVPQERFLSLLTPMLFHGDAAWGAVDALATEWAADVLDGRVRHGVYSV